MAAIAAEAGASSRRAMSGSAWSYGRWVSRPAQNRSERTFFRFLDAAEGLLSGRNWHEVSVQEIVRQADASVGSFYNRFVDKTALLRCLDSRLGQECEQTVSALVDELDTCPALIDDAPGMMISLFMRLCSERSGVIRALDMAQKMAEPGDFTGLGPSFDAAAEKIGHLLAEKHAVLKDHSGVEVAQAFRESFWLTREMLLYHPPCKPADEVHRSLLRHFYASLQD
ncbi:helix-turn-helix domain-containing protein [Kordiimonas lipolytica]|uniref:Helix-turn-helix domain-containing protein n=1 Tax=Kordiimonas lipolytica TaxID=1662421 RepID=A0ABV8U8I5_9PROT|nr:TetR/AcrR family transcriptional regulator [Kordiimonas lipolytica]